MSETHNVRIYKKGMGSLEKEILNRLGASSFITGP